MTKTWFGIQSPPAQSRLVVCVCVWVVCVAASCFAGGKPVDDAFIAYRYAFNLLTHGELVWNLGERVEGSTSLLWPLLVAGSAAFAKARAHAEIPLDAQYLATFLHATTGALICLLLCMRGISSWAAGAAAAAIQLAPDVFGTAHNGLESQLFAMLLGLLVLAVLLRRPALTGMLGALVFATRPEGVVAAVLACWAVHTLTKHRRRWLAWCVLGLGVCAVETFRAVYYGDWIPNSVTAKSIPLAALPGVAFHLGLPYLGKFLLDPFRLALVLASLWSAQRGFVHLRRRDSWSAFVALAPVVALSVASAVVLRNGGDWMPNYRLVLQYTSIYALAMVEVIGSATAVRGVSGAAAAVLASYGLHWTSGRPLATQPMSHRIPDIYLKLPERLNRVGTSQDLVSAEMAGYLPYAILPLRAHDPLGLLNATIAHIGIPTIPFGKDAPEYTLFQVRPTFVVYHWAGHMRGLNPERVTHDYLALCAAGCECDEHAQDANVLLIRRDRAIPAVLQEFSDLKPWSVSCLHEAAR